MPNQVIFQMRERFFRCRSGSRCPDAVFHVFRGVTVPLTPLCGFCQRVDWPETDFSKSCLEFLIRQRLVGHSSDEATTGTMDRPVPGQLSLCTKVPPPSMSPQTQALQAADYKSIPNLIPPLGSNASRFVSPPFPGFWTKLRRKAHCHPWNWRRPMIRSKQTVRSRLF